MPDNTALVRHELSTGPDKHASCCEHSFLGDVDTFQVSLREQRCANRTNQLGTASPILGSISRLDRHKLAGLSGVI